MEINYNLSEINAEMLLNYLYPELQDKWIARHEGTFFRNYNDDALSIDETTAKLSLARDGFLKLLPQGFITQDDELKKGDFGENYQSLQKRKRILEETFLPFDTFAFRQRLQLEREVSQILEGKLEFVLKKYFNFDLATETDSYVKEIALMLPYISKWRGDLGFVRKLLANIIDCEVEMKISRYSHSDTSRCTIPYVQYHLIMNDIDSEKYNLTSNSLIPLKNFIVEWFIPFEVKCDIVLKHHDDPLVLDNNMILNYNTEL